MSASSSTSHRFIGLFCSFTLCILTALTPEVIARSFKYDFSDFQIGTAENRDGPTGCTVLLFPKSVLAAVDIRGGATATRETSSIDPLNAWGQIDALVLSGGSTYGLESASGVMEKILEVRGGKVDFESIPSVPAAAVYDFGGRRNSIYPDKALGALATTRARTGEVEIGAFGAGANVTVGKYFGETYSEKSGQGAAFISVGKIKIFALTVVNAMGNVLDQRGNIVAGSLDPRTHTRFSIPQRLLQQSLTQAGAGTERVTRNTTITVIVTNAVISRSDLGRLAVMAHTAMGRVIEPFQTPWDGDTLFAVSTSTEKLGSQLNVIDIGTLAGAVVQNAVLAAVAK